MARFIKLLRRTNKEVYVNPDYVAAFETSEQKGCCTLRFADGNTIELKVEIEVLATFLSPP